MGDKAKGEAKTVSILQPTEQIQNAASSAIPIPAQKATDKAPNKGKDVNNALKNCAKNAADCKQSLWFSFFFDGTGNNLVADFPSQEHTNVTRLFRAHRGDAYLGSVHSKGPNDATGIFRIYVPGIGTYFSEVNDPGGDEWGLGIGYYGQNRLDWAKKQFDQLMVVPISLAKNNLANEIIEVNIAAFGFSRGAAAARAFINDFVSSRCDKDSARTNGLRLKSIKCVVHIKFLGLFDTVASVGPGASANVIKKLEVRAPLAVKIASRYAAFPDSKPGALAFSHKGVPGAEPAAGTFNGHAGFGGKMFIPDEVENVYHFIAGHEFRNSFPVDSISVYDEKTNTIPSRKNFYEYVHGGVHSDVGGGYSPGEGGKNEAPETKLGLVFLWKMYSFALGAGVPLLAESAWNLDNKSDFNISKKLLADYEYYLKKTGAGNLSVGEQIRAHMKLYYQWRFYIINKKLAMNGPEKISIDRNAAKFAVKQKKLESDIAELERKCFDADRTLSSMESAANAPGVSPWKYLTKTGPFSKDYPAQIKTQKQRSIDALENLRRAQARLLTLPKETGLSQVIGIYDQQLLKDVADIVAQYPSDGKNSVTHTRDNLRPHYRVILAAYEDERDGKGLTDPAIIAFFEDYVHNSLAAFAMDATLPSDPRIVYAGLNYRLQFAGASKSDGAEHYV